jgi:hypothetical protein
MVLEPFGGGGGRDVGHGVKLNENHVTV